MALFHLMRNAGSAIVPAALRTLSRQRTIHSAIGFAVQSRSIPKIGKWNLLMDRRTAFTSSLVAKSKADENLSKVLDSEIKCAVDSDPPKEEIVPPDAIPFDIEDKPGHQSVILRRKYGNEDIKVEAMGIDIAEPEASDENDEDGAGNSGHPQLNLNVTISKGDGPSLEFNCSAFADEIVIDMMSVKDSKRNADILAYEGPAFADLDENLQKSFHKYLEVRGIKASLSNYLMEYMINKDNKEYVRWLKNVKHFVEN